MIDDCPALCYARTYTCREMFMVLLASSEQNKPMLIVAAALWPVFFYPMYKQLLKQRRKHVQSISKSKTKEIKAV